MTTGKRSAGLAFLAAGLLALGGWTPAFADNLTPDSPYSQPGQTATNQSGTPSGSQKATQADMDKFNSEFHNSFQNLMPDAPPPGYSTMMGKWVTTMYGFVQVDTVYDSSNSYNNWPFNAAPANAGVTGNSGTPQGSQIDSGRFGMDVNNSRIGFALSSPVYNGYKIRALLEMDFLAAPTPGAPAFGGSGLGYVTNPIFRIRHFFFDVTTPSWGNVLVGQYWSLFGWQPYNIQNNLQIAPGPGTAYGRFPQIRWYKILHMDQATQGLMLEPAVAIMLPPTTTSGMPSFTEGLKLSDSHLMTEMMIGDTGKGQFPASIGISGIEQNYSGYNNGNPALYPAYGNTSKGAGFNSWTAAGAVDLILPIIPIHNDKPGNNLTLQAEYTWGQGDAWQFPNLSFGLGGNSVNTPGGGGAGYAGNGVIMNNGFLPLDIQTYNADLQYYFPDDARTSVVVGFAVDNASNLQQIANVIGGGGVPLGGAGGTNALVSYLQPDTHLTFAYVDLWHDFTPAVRAGLEFGQYDAVYTNGMNALDNRVMMSWFYLF
ncbi:MAG: hypothetical protein M1313_05325 [Nitrospirae bacterium]|nr:hypothetical protein [Nitrospirota bacterium]